MESDKSTNKDIIIREVTNKDLLKKFADFPNILYKDKIGRAHV